MQTANSQYGDAGDEVGMMQSVEMRYCKYSTCILAKIVTYYFHSINVFVVCP